MNHGSRAPCFGYFIKKYHKKNSKCIETNSRFGRYPFAAKWVALEVTNHMINLKFIEISPKIL